MTNKFKQMVLLLCFAASVMMVSCNKDKETETGSADIVASWKCTYSSTYDEYRDDSGEWQSRMLENKYKGEIMTLSEDGKVFINSREKGTYTKTFSTIIFDCERMVDGLYNIVTLTSSKLKLQQLNRDNEVDEWCDVFEFERM